MGLIGKVLGNPRVVGKLGAAISGVAEVFTPNATKKLTMSHAAFVAALAQYQAEFQTPPIGWFDRFINGLNRLPRPALALGTLGLFVYAMVSPEAFGERMKGLALVPEALWWLLGAIVSFYFGARETYYARVRATPRPGVSSTLPVPPPPPGRSPNPALEEWAGSNGK